MLFERDEQAEAIKRSRGWSTPGLMHVARELGAELVRRGRPAPIALEVGLRVHGEVGSGKW